MSEVCRICFRPTTIQPDGCPCWGDGSVESELDCFQLGVKARDEKLAASERENKAWRTELSEKTAETRPGIGEKVWIQCEIVECPREDVVMVRVPSLGPIKVFPVPRAELRITPASPTAAWVREQARETTCPR